MIVAPLGPALESAEEFATRLRRTKREELEAKTSVGPPSISPIRGDRVLYEALNELQSEIKEPTALLKNGAESIDTYIRHTGLKWPTADAVHWKPYARYVKNGQFSWCGAFAAHCYAAAGLKEKVRHDFFSSATRLFDKGPHGAWAGSEKGVRLVKKFDDIRPGDVLVMGYVGRPSHIGLVYKVSPRSTPERQLLLTIEGNARGYSFGWDTRGFREEKTYEGVIMQERLFSPAGQEYGVLRVIRPIEKDYEI